MKVLSARVWYNSCELQCRTIYLNHFLGKPDFSVFKSLLLGRSDSAERFLQSPACNGQVLPAFQEGGGGGAQLQCARVRGIPLLLVPCPCLLSARIPQIMHPPFYFLQTSGQLCKVGERFLTSINFPINSPYFSSLFTPMQINLMLPFGDLLQRKSRGLSVFLTTSLYFHILELLSHLPSVYIRPSFQNVVAIESPCFA